MNSQSQSTQNLPICNQSSHQRAHLQAAEAFQQGGGQLWQVGPDAGGAPQLHYLAHRVQAQSLHASAHISRVILLSCFRISVSA